MAYPDGAIKVRLIGTLASPEETFDTGFGFLSTTTPFNSESETRRQEYVDDLAAWVATSFGTAWANIASRFPTTTDFMSVKVSHVNPAGLVQVQQEVPLNGGTGHQGSSTSPSLPLEVAEVVSLYGYDTGDFVPLRARKRGRMYLPPWSTAQMSSGGRFLDAACQDLADFVGDFLTSVNNFPGTLNIAGGNVSVLSSAGAGLATTVVRVAVGDVPDAQRRRRRSQVEEYFEGAVT